jgi:hypothetical protein
MHNAYVENVPCVRKFFMCMMLYICLSFLHLFVYALLSRVTFIVGSPDDLSAQMTYNLPTHHMEIGGDVLAF